MSNDKELRTEAEQLYERRLDVLQKKAKQEQEAEREKGIRSAIKDIQEQRRKERIARDRKEAAARADELSRQRYELEKRIEDEAMQLRRSLNELESLHSRQGNTLREAGRPLDHGFGFQEMISTRFRQWFGGWNSLTGVPSPFHGAQDLPLYERDSLASPGEDGAA
jgi:hypothetical protein